MKGAEAGQKKVDELSKEVEYTKNALDAQKYDHEQQMDELKQKLEAMQKRAVAAETKVV